MTEQTVLDVFRLQGLAEQGVRAKIDHARRKIIAGSPVSIHLPEFFGRERGQDFG
jgi:hypothetical protein